MFGTIFYFRLEEVTVAFKNNYCCFFSGFLGVYLAGYILDVTGSWAQVFNFTALVNLIGISVFVTFGSGKPIL